MSLVDNPEFRSLLETTLKDAGVSDDDIQIFLSQKNLKEFETAFTHPSFGAEKDYQLYEFVGDVVINEFVPFYVKQRFPKLISKKWCVQIKHNLVGKKMLSFIARQLSFDKFIRYGFKMKEAMKEEPDFEENDEYKSMLEDVVEAFFGCLNAVVVGSGFHHGVATQISHNILKPILDKQDIRVKYDEVFDPITRLKELYESTYQGYKWSNVDAYKTRQVNNGMYQVSVFGWPKGNQECVPANMVLLASHIHKSKDRAKVLAADAALKVLEAKYSIAPKPLDPYSNDKNGNYLDVRP